MYKITGFSLIEQAIIISLLSIIAISLNKYNEKQDFNHKFKETKRRFTVIQLAIEETYLNKIIRSNFHDFLCPGDLNGKVNCINFKFLYKSQILLSGYVPFKSLNLPEYYSYDSWGNKIKYNIYDLDKPNRTVAPHRPDLLNQYSDMLLPMISFRLAQKLEEFNDAPRIAKKVTF